jgi:hypothetical protein
MLSSILECVFVGSVTVVTCEKQDLRFRMVDVTSRSRRFSVSDLRLKNGRCCFAVFVSLKFTAAAAAEVRSSAGRGRD